MTRTPENWYGLRCWLKFCPCRTADFDGEVWAICVQCGAKRVPLNAAAIKTTLKES